MQLKILNAVSKFSQNRTYVYILLIAISGCSSSSKSFGNTALENFNGRLFLHSHLKTN